MPPVRRSLTQARAAWRDALARSQRLAARAARTSHLRAVAAGLRAPEIATLHAGGGPNASGLFSEVASAIGFLDHFEQWRHCYAGMRVDYHDGLYLDPARGANWWTYYFEPIAIGAGDGRSRAVGQPFHDQCAMQVETTMPRERAAALVARYVRVTPAVERRVDAVVSAEWSSNVIGVHYRGTDKAVDARRVPYDEVAAAVQSALMATNANGTVFVATDECAFVDFMRERFRGRVTARPMFRSADGRPIDVVNADGNYQKGLDAVVDCVLLSRTRFLVRTASNLSLCATFFNPSLPCVLLNPER